MTDAHRVEPMASNEKLLLLPAMGAEPRHQYFKAEVDLDEHAELVELAMGVAAFLSCGGHLVVPWCIAAYRGSIAACAGTALEGPDEIAAAKLSMSSSSASVGNIHWRSRRSAAMPMVGRTRAS